MNQTNAKLIETVYRRLRQQPRQRVLEIGFGNGHTAPLLIQQADALTYTGIEIAQTMVAEATAFNQALIDAGQATFRLAPAEAMPFGDATFALAVNVIYFWRDAVRALTEICRVLRPGGLSIVASMDSATAAAAPFYRAEFEVSDPRSERTCRDAPHGGVCCCRYRTIRRNDEAWRRYAICSPLSSGDRRPVRLLINQCGTRGPVVPCPRRSSGSPFS
jgi:SAM-dependent methyltransferase